MMELKEEIIETKEVFKGDYITVEKTKVKLPDGNIANRDVIKHPGAVAVVAFKDDETILLVEQYRTAVNKITLEIPAGKIEKGENHLIAIKRELEEEAGYKSDNIEFLGAISPGPGYTDEIIYIYKATDLYKGVKGGDDDEFINVKSYKLSEIKNMIKEGIIFDAKTIASLMYI